MKKNQNKKSKKPSILALSVVAVVIISGLIYAFMTDRSPFSKAGDNSAKTTSTAESAQSDFSDGDDRQPQVTTPKTEGTVSDNNGAVGSVPSSSQWSSSKSGAVTAYSPAKNSKVTNGSAISGSATGSRVSFRIIDNVSGVISQGELSVVGGKFSGTLSFSTTATEGRLDLFTTRADGVEENNVEIPVRF